MDRLLAIAGGQKLKAEDWGFIQDANEDTFKSIVKGLVGNSTSIIITGLIAIIGDGVINVSDGYLFKDDEIFYVPSATFTDHGETWFLYLTPDITTGELRTFKDTSTHNVYEYRHYNIGYAASIPSGSVGFPGSNLLGLITNHVVAQVPAPPAQLVKYISTLYAVSVLNNAQILIPAPGVGIAVKVIGITAWLSPISTLNVGAQDLNVSYIDDDRHASIGSFPNSFVESNIAKMRDMTLAPDDIYLNQAVKIQLSLGAAVTSGSGSIRFHCFYVLISL